MTMEKSKRTHRGISLTATGIIMAVVAFVISSLLIISLYVVSNQFNFMHESMENYMGWKNSASNVQLASDYLTEEIHSFVAMDESQSFEAEATAKHLENYFTEVKSLRRQNAISDIEKRLANSPALDSLKDAVNKSVALENEEYAAMRAIVDARHDTALITVLSQEEYVEYYQAILAFDINKSAYISNPANNVNYDALSDDEKIDLASILVFGELYESQKEAIYAHVNDSLNELDEMMKASVHGTAMTLKKILFAQQALIGLNIAFLVGIILLAFFYVVRPIRRAVGNLSNGESVDIRKGAREYRYLAETYNQVHEQNLQSQERLIYEAEHDKLTGLYNRDGYDSIYSKIKLDKSVYILIDVDKFKAINDKKGHAVGDNVLIRVSKAISKYFNEENASVFRLGGDEFSVIIEGVDQEESQKLLEQCHQMNAELKQDKGDSPSVSLSIGIAFGESNDTTDTLFKKADIALYNTKRNGRSNACIYNKELKMEED